MRTLQPAVPAYSTPHPTYANPAQFPAQLPSIAPQSIAPSQSTSLDSSQPSQTSLADVNSALTSRTTRPSAAAIAIPLSICFFILLCALTYCARSRAFRKPQSSDVDLEKKDWQEIIKAKAEAAKSRSNVTITERKEPPILPILEYDAPYRSKRGGSEMSSRSGTRCLTPIREMEHFTSVPAIHYGRYGRRSRDPKEYYATSRRSASGLGGEVDGSDRYCDYHTKRPPVESRCTTCVREASQGSIYNPHPPPPPPPPPPTLTRSTHTRPLPEPMIRTHTSDWENEPTYLEKGKSGSSLKPHESGVLQRDPSGQSMDSEEDWELAGEGRYEDKERGMGELYDCLRRAIGTPR